MYYLLRAVRVPPPGPQGQPHDPTWRFEVTANTRYSRCQGRELKFARPRWMRREDFDE
jgi:hypothetical protein